MKNMRNFFWPAVVLLLFATACNRSVQAPQAPQHAQNVILLIGDGMGMAQISTTFYYGDNPSNFTRFKQIGFHDPIPSGAKVTDSAAGATAFSTGYKSYNTAIGVDEDTVARKTILELAAKKGKKTGLVATSSITHATPAAFYAHVKDRNMEEEIATQLLEAPVDFFAGGGLKFFTRRSDGQNYLRNLIENGYVVNSAALMPKELETDKRYGFFLGQEGLPSKPDGRDDFLPEATGMALDYLSQHKDGFFLMVEGSQIDWGGHDNDADYIIQETQDFNQAIGVALDFAEKDGNTLVIVTADHETGGFSLAPVGIYGQQDYRQIEPKFGTTGHSATLIPVFAYGPGAERFQGIYPNNAIFEKMKKSFLK